MATKKIEIVLDVDGKPIDVVIDKTLNLKQQFRELTKELNRTKEGTKEFELLSTKLGDVKDQMQTTTAKSRDLFGSLSLLPGPVGMFAGSVDSAIGSLKLFSSFSFKDLKFQLAETLNDFKDIASNIGKATGITKIYTTLNNALAKSFVAVGVGEQAAAVGARAFSAALVATGIGALVVLLAAAASGLYQMATGEDAATEASKRFNSELESQNELLDLNKASTKRRNAEMIAVMKAQGKSEKEIRDATLAQSYKDYTAAQAAEVDAVNIFNAKIAKANEEDAKKLQKNLDDRVKERKDAYSAYIVLGYTNKAEENKLEDQKNKELQAKNKQNADKIAADRKTALDALLDLQQENAVLSEKNERKAALIELKNSKVDEENKIKALRISTELRNQILEQINIKYKQKEADTNKKFDDEALKTKDEFLKKRLDLEVQAYEDSADLQIKALTETYNNEVEIYKKQVAEFNTKNKAIQISEEEQTAYLLALQVKFNKDRIKINDEASLKILQTSTNIINSYKENFSQLNNEFDQNTRTFQARFQLIGTETFMTVKRVKEALEALRGKNEMFEPVQLAQMAMQRIKENIKIAIDGAKKLYEEGKLSKEQYDKFVKEKDAENLEAQLNYANKLIEYDLLVADSKKALVDQSVEIAEKTVDLFQAGIAIADANYQLEQKRLNDRLALYQKDSEEYNKILKEKENLERDHIKKIQNMQIAAAIAEGAIAIARVVIDTQRAIVAFTASVAGLGLPGIPMAAAYAVKSQILAALSIATIIAQGIAKVKSIQSGSASSGSGGSSAGGGNGLGRGYAEGGLIKGRRHAQGGTIIEAEDGEAIMTRGAVTMFGPMLSMMNQAGGGTTFASNLFTRPDNPMVKNPVLESQTQIIKTYVVENELTSSQQRQARLKDLSTL
jgi:hypothetical protein